MMIGTLTLGSASALLAQDAAGLMASPSTPAGCLDSGEGFLRARLSGSLQTELDWRAGMTCTGDLRPGDGGLRLRFSHPAPQGGAGEESLVIVFGMALPPAQQTRDLPVNVTVIREGRGEFYSTQGENKCLLDELRLTPLDPAGATLQVLGRGFCTQPARAVRGEGAVLISRFDFAGRLDLPPEARTPAPAEDPIVRSPPGCDDTARGPCPRIVQRR